MADRVEQVTEQTNNLDGQRVVTRAVNQDSREAQVGRAVRVVWFIIGVVVVFLLVRVVLALIGANLENPFASFVYTVTEPFVAGFRGLLQIGEFQAGIARLELETLIAALIYILIGWGIASAIRLLSKKS